MTTIKERLKNRLLEIPINDKAFREKYILARDLNVNSDEIEYYLIEYYLNELVKLNILIEKKQYKCPNCRDTTIMNDEFLNEILEDGYFLCDNCYEFINPNKDATGYVYYDIKNRKLLEDW